MRVSYQSGIRNVKVQYLLSEGHSAVQDTRHLCLTGKQSLPPRCVGFSFFVLEWKNIWNRKKTQKTVDGIKVIVCKSLKPAKFFKFMRFLAMLATLGTKH